MNKKRHKEWEAKCKQCGLCCHDKDLLDDALIIYDKHCEYLVDNKCSVYDRRFEVKPECMKLTPENVKKIKWLPKSCGLKA